MGSDEIHPRVLMELANVVAKPLSIISEKLWQSSKVPAGWKRGNVMSIFKREKSNYWALSFPSGHRKIMEHFPLETVLRHMENKQVISGSQNS